MFPSSSSGPPGEETEGTNHNHTTTTTTTTTNYNKHHTHDNSNTRRLGDRRSGTSSSGELSGRWIGASSSSGPAARTAEPGRLHKTILTCIDVIVMTIIVIMLCDYYCNDNNNSPRLPRPTVPLTVGRRRSVFGTG